MPFVGFQVICKRLKDVQIFKNDYVRKTNKLMTPKFTWTIHIEKSKGGDEYDEIYSMGRENKTISR